MADGSSIQFGSGSVQVCVTRTHTIQFCSRMIGSGTTERTNRTNERTADRGSWPTLVLTLLGEFRGGSRSRLQGSRVDGRSMNEEIVGLLLYITLHYGTVMDAAAVVSEVRDEFLKSKARRAGGVSE